MSEVEENTPLLPDEPISKAKTEKPLLPQIVAAITAGSFFFTVGFAHAFSGVLVPQLLEEQNCTDGRKIVPVTQADTAWIASTIRLLSPPCALLGGFMMDFWGRLNLLKIATVPSLLGWIIMGAAKTRDMLIVGRMLSGVPIVWASAVFVYIAEISSTEMRGTLLATTQVFVAMGMLIIYLLGYLMHWRVIAWIFCIISVLPSLLVILIPESPPWLVFKGRLISANTSLKWFTRRKLGDEQSINEEFNKLVEEKSSKERRRMELNDSKILAYMKNFLKPTVYKPLMIIIGLFFFQSASGVFTVAFLAVTFFRNVGTTLDPYLVAVVMGVIRVIMTVINIGLINRCNRRSLLFFSTIGMAISIGLSGLYTSWILIDKESHDWVPVLSLMAYVLTSMVGFLPLPFLMSGEVFPLEVRGVAQNIIATVSTLMMFAVIQCYFTMNEILGPDGLQYFFSAMSLAGCVYCFVFVPETHNKSLAEIEQYFVQNWCYLSFKKRVPREYDLATQNKDTLYGSGSKFP